MRAVRGAQDRILKQQLGAVDPKFDAGPNELEQENELKILQPTNAEQLKQLSALVETLRRQNQGDAGWQNALRFWQMQITTGALSDRVKFEFVRRFYFWLLGRGTAADVARTTWGRANAAVVNREVALYIQQFSQRRLDYALQLALLAQRVPTTLNGYYLYFKYIVNGKLERSKDNNNGSWWQLADDDYLQDFELFQQEFDGTTGKSKYKDIIRPAGENGGGGFDASRPFPSSNADMGKYEHKQLTNAELVQQSTKQLNEGVNHPLPQAMAPAEQGMSQPPVRSAAQPIPQPGNEGAVGIAAANALLEFIGEQRKWRIADVEERQQKEVVKQQQKERDMQAAAQARSIPVQRDHAIDESAARVQREEIERLSAEMRAGVPAQVVAGVATVLKDELAAMGNRYDSLLRAHAEGQKTMLATGELLSSTKESLVQIQQMLMTMAQAKPAEPAVHNAAELAQRVEKMTTALEGFAARGYPQPPSDNGSGAAAIQAATEQSRAAMQTWITEQVKQSKEAADVHTATLQRVAQDSLGNIANTTLKFMEVLETAKRGFEAGKIDKEREAAIVQQAHEAQLESVRLKQQLDAAVARAEVAEAHAKSKSETVREVEKVVQVRDAEDIARIDAATKALRDAAKERAALEQQLEQTRRDLAATSAKTRAQGEQIARQEQEVQMAQAEANVARVKALAAEKAQRETAAQATAKAREQDELIARREQEVQMAQAEAEAARVKALAAEKAAQATAKARVVKPKPVPAQKSTAPKPNLRGPELQAALKEHKVPARASKAPTQVQNKAEAKALAAKLRIMRDEYDRTAARAQKSQEPAAILEQLVLDVEAEEMEQQLVVFAAQDAEVQREMDEYFSNDVAPEEEVLRDLEQNEAVEAAFADEEEAKRQVEATQHVLTEDEDEAELAAEEALKEDINEEGKEQVQKEDYEMQQLQNWAHEWAQNQTAEYLLDAEEQILAEITRREQNKEDTRRLRAQWHATRARLRGMSRYPQWKEAKQARKQARVRAQQEKEAQATKQKHEQEKARIKDEQEQVLDRADDIEKKQKRNHEEALAQPADAAAANALVPVPAPEPQSAAKVPRVVETIPVQIVAEELQAKLREAAAETAAPPKNLQEATGILQKQAVESLHGKYKRAK